MSGEWLQGPNKLYPADSYTTTRLDGAVKLKTQFQNEPLYDVKPVSLFTVFKTTARKHPNHLALSDNKDGQKRNITYAQYWELCLKTAKSFIKLGLKPHCSVAIMGFNAPEWFFSIYGSIFAGGVACGIYTTNSAETCEFILSDSKSEIMVVENELYLNKILKSEKNKANLKAIIQYNGEVKDNHNGLVYTWNEFMKLSESVSDEVLDKRIMGIAPNKCATLIYTSGTTGNPKAAMLSHDNIVYTIQYATQYLQIFEAKERIVSYLPLSHVAAQWLDCHFAINHGASVYFAQPDALKGSLGATINEVKPTLFFGVPRVWEKMEEKIMSMAKASTTPVSPDKVKHLLGLGEARFTFTGAAPTKRSTVEFFKKFGIIITEVYGLSESTGPHVISLAHHNITSSVGCCISQFNRIKILSPDENGNGEICLYGRHIFMGYLNNEEKTKEAIDKEGWLHTGDLGKLDENNFLFITGRVKEILITSGGENISPVPIEEAIVARLPDVISNVMVVCDNKNYVTALITLKSKLNPDTGAGLDDLADECIKWLKEHNSNSKKVSEVMENEDEVCYEAIRRAIDEANEKAISKAAHVQKFAIVPRDFSLATGELGPTLKLRRHIVAKMYAVLIDRMYQS